MRVIFCAAWLALAAAAQTPVEPDWATRTRDLRTAIQNGSLASAAEMARKLDDAVQRQYTAWLIRDGAQRVDEARAWLPPDTESLWVNQQPFTIDPQESTHLLYERPIRQYSLDRLIALDGGRFYRALGGRTVRIVVAAARNISREQRGIPGPVLAHDVFYVYFFATAVDLPDSDESIQGRPVWRATAKVYSRQLPEPGKQPERVDDENWLALARPDVLILTNRRELIEGVLQRAAQHATTLTLPNELPEWAHVNSKALFWGLRHYSAQSKPSPGERYFRAADLPRPDGAATGVTVEFDPDRQRLQMLYLSGSELRPRRGSADTLYTQFQIDRPETGLWRLNSDIQARGPWPVSFAFTMLGFGIYQ